MKKINLILIVTLVPITFANTLAQTVKFDFLFGIGWTRGGDNLRVYPITVTSEYGSHYETESIEAGEARIYTLGGKLYFANFPVGIQFTWNDYASLQHNVEGLDDNFRRHSINIIPYFRIKQFRIGIGVSYYYHAEFIEDAEGNGISAHGDYQMEHTKGYIYEVDYVWDVNKFVSSFSIGLRYTQVKFKPYDINGSNGGLFFLLAI